MKVIVKNKETGKQNCIDISKERENDSDVKALKVGMTVTYAGGNGFESVEIVKIVDDRPLSVTLKSDWSPYPWQCMYMGGRSAGRTIITKKFLEDVKEIREAKEAKKEYQEKPYFLVRLDPIKGQSDSEENLEKMKFPCWVVYKSRESGKHHIGMLVTGYPDVEVEYQLIDMMKQVPVGEVCTVQRDTSLEKLIKRWNIEVIKGQTQLWKLGRFDV